ncbi:MAG: hypothetical protein AAF799_30055 [Myxococcota bacterium]
MLRLVALALVPLLASAVSCSTSEVFECRSNDQCVTSMIRGQCEPAGVCSFPDLGCDSGRRYGSSSGDLSGQCVEDGATSTSTSTSTSPESGSTAMASSTDSGNASSTDATSSTDTSESSSDTGPVPDGPYGASCAAGMCRDMNTSCVNIGMTTLCAPICMAAGENAACPMPTSGKAEPACLEFQDGDLPNCVLICSDMEPCPDGMVCEDIAQQIQICGWP